VFAAGYNAQRRLLRAAPGWLDPKAEWSPSDIVPERQSGVILGSILTHFGAKRAQKCLKGAKIWQFQLLVS
jgi:hypothetical protein